MHYFDIMTWLVYFENRWSYIFTYWHWSSALSRIFLCFYFALTHITLHHHVENFWQDFLWQNLIKYRSCKDLLQIGSMFLLKYIWKKHIHILSLSSSYVWKSEIWWMYMSHAYRVILIWNWLEIKSLKW